MGNCGSAHIGLVLRHSIKHHSKCFFKALLSKSLVINISMTFFLPLQTVASFTLGARRYEFHNPIAVLIHNQILLLLPLQNRICIFTQQYNNIFVYYRHQDGHTFWMQWDFLYTNLLITSMASKHDVQKVPPHWENYLTTVVTLFPWW